MKLWAEDTQGKLVFPLSHKKRGNLGSLHNSWTGRTRGPSFGVTLPQTASLGETWSSVFWDGNRDGREEGLVRWTSLGCVGALQDKKEGSQVVSIRDRLLVFSAYTERGNWFDYERQFGSWGWSSLIHCISCLST